jgi:hypothetical protein
MKLLVASNRLVGPLPTCNVGHCFAWQIRVRTPEEQHTVLFKYNISYTDLTTENPNIPSTLLPPGPPGLNRMGPW